MKIGEILMEAKIISSGQLEQALSKQKNEPGKKIGEILIEMNLLTYDTLLKYLEQKT